MTWLALLRLVLLFAFSFMNMHHFSVGAWLPPSTKFARVRGHFNYQPYQPYAVGPHHGSIPRKTERLRCRPSLNLAKGFEKQSSEKPPLPRIMNQSTEGEEDVNRIIINDNNTQNENGIYANPSLYDLAFGYRDFEEETDFLLARHMDLTQTPATRILEVAAGPARHAMAALHDDGDEDRNTSVQSVYCVDLSPNMAEFALENAGKWFLDPTTVARFHYQVDDMRNFQLDSETMVDSAWLLLGSLQHLTTNDDVIQCFQSIHKAVAPGGTLFLELPHPRETFSIVECTRNSWVIPLGLEADDDLSYAFDDEEDDSEGRNEMPLDDSSSGSKLKIIWGDDGDDFDPITQVRQFTVATELIGDAIGPEELSDLPRELVTRQVVPMRLFTAQEIDALARCTGWKVVAMYGALMEGVALDNEDTAFRLVCALQK